MPLLQILRIEQAGSLSGGLCPVPQVVLSPCRRPSSRQTQAPSVAIQYSLPLLPSVPIPPFQAGRRILSTHGKGKDKAIR